jgi:hypothetical protein
MLRKLALAVGAVAFCGAVQAHAGISKEHNNDNKGDKGDKGDKPKLVVPEFKDNCDLTKWIKSLDCKAEHGDLFAELLTSHKDSEELGFCLPKCDVRILADLRSDIKDVIKDMDEADHKHDKDRGKDDFKGREDIKSDLCDIRTDLCDFADHLKNGCDRDRHCEPTAVPLPAAAAQGLVGMGMLGLTTLVGAVRRRKSGQA